MSDYRNLNNIELARLKNTEHLAKKLSKGSISNVRLETKGDGNRISFEFSENEPLLVSRNRHLKAKGVKLAKKEPFIVSKISDFKGLPDIRTDIQFVLDGEILVYGVERSTSSGVLRLDTEKEFRAFDVLAVDNKPVTDKPLSVRLKILDDLFLDFFKKSERIKKWEGKTFKSFSSQDLDDHLNLLKKSTEEGYVLKPLDWPYQKNNYGWKIKLEDNEDAFVTEVYEEKTSNLGTSVRTGRCGTVAVSQLDKNGQRVRVAVVALPELLRIPLSMKNNLIDMVVEFSHLGWDGEMYKFTSWVVNRTDKDICDCTFNKEEK
jgi:ATP-dependent DNA ligase